MKKIYLVALAVLLLVLGASTVSAGFLDGLSGGNDDNSNSPGLDGKTQYKLFAYQPMSVESIVEEIDSNTDFYDNTETRDWLAGLDNDYVYLVADDGPNVIMNRSEANLLPVQGLDPNAEVDYFNIIKCNVNETHSLGTGSIDCVLVENVEFIENVTEPI